jgi:energy-coupling factor transporter ATP-binding protein EcfA2
MADSVIDVENVQFSYLAAHQGTSPYGARTELQTFSGDKRLVLDDISFTVPAGSITVLCGASGSGKSSALRLLNGLVPNFHHGTLTGTVTVAGVDVPKTDLAEAGRTTATVFQNPRTQFFTAEVRSELAFRDENYGLAPAEIERRTASAARATGVEHLLDRSLRGLSGGELQRVACTQAIVAGTPVLLFDEPTSNLSPAAIAEFAELLARLKCEGRAIVVAEHRLYFLRDLVDQVLLLDHGRLRHRWSGAEFRSLTEGEAEHLGLRTLRAPAALPQLLDAEHAELTGEAPMALDTAHLGLTETSPVDAHAGLTLENVRFRYGRREVLDIDGLTFPRGQVSVVAGSNGVGKSTLSRVICGLATPRRGAVITLDGHRFDSRSRIRHSAMVMQDVHRQLFSDTVREELLLGLDATARSSVDVDALLEEFDLAQVADRHPLSLSGGQKQRVVIAAALARNPDICVFDEPTSGVDRRHLTVIAGRLHRLARAGTVVIVITHDPELIDACADRVVRVGRLTADRAARRQHVSITPIPRGE